jgi:hypothetical protein
LWQESSRNSINVFGTSNVLRFSFTSMTVILGECSTWRTTKTSSHGLVQFCLSEWHCSQGNFGTWCHSHGYLSECT